jgi:hypothetical protein
MSVITRSVRRMPRTGTADRVDGEALLEFLRRRSLTVLSPGGATAGPALARRLRHPSRALDKVSALHLLMKAVRLAQCRSC